MSTFSFAQLAIKCVAAAVPAHVHTFDQSSRRAARFSKQMGIDEVHISVTEQTALDLGYVALKQALAHVGWQAQDDLYGRVPPLSKQPPKTALCAVPAITLKLFVVIIRAINRQKARYLWLFASKWQSTVQVGTRPRFTDLRHANTRLSGCSGRFPLAPQVLAAQRVLCGL